MSFIFIPSCQTGYKFLLKLILIGCLFAQTASASPSHAEILPTLPKVVRMNHFKQVDSDFKKRWQEYAKGRDFVVWTKGRTQDSVVQEFDNLNNKRRAAWFEEPNADVLVAQPDYQVAQDLLAKGLYRNLNTLGFEYNKTDNSFNSNTVVVGKHRFLALEGPKEEHIPAFFNLLVNHHVTQLVRLTPAFEGTESKCADYWENRVTVGADGKSTINIPQSTQGSGVPYQVSYHVIEDWMDHTPGTPDQLLDFVLQLKNAAKANKDSLIAVHCSSGVSRTGTVIAAYLLLDDIDQQIKSGTPPNKINISVEKTVSQLSLQRPHAVGKPLQYVTLYKTVDLYIDRLSRKS